MISGQATRAASSEMWFAMIRASSAFTSARKDAMATDTQIAAQLVEKIFALIDQRRVDVSRTSSNVSCNEFCLSVGRSVGSVGFLSGYGSYVITCYRLSLHLIPHEYALWIGEPWSWDIVLSKCTFAMPLLVSLTAFA